MSGSSQPPSPEHPKLPPVDDSLKITFQARSVADEEEVGLPEAVPMSVSSSLVRWPCLAAGAGAGLLLMLAVIVWAALLPNRTTWIFWVAAGIAAVLMVAGLVAVISVKRH
jgi:hypothetical protein